MKYYLVETVSAFLPLARRRFNTSLPDFEAVLARKPCFFARLLVLGWYVRLGIIVKTLVPLHYYTSGKLASFFKSTKMAYTQSINRL